MLLNLVVSASIGLVPGIGDILLASFRANVRNAKLLENFLVMRGERAGKATQAATLQEKRGDESRGAERSAEDDPPAPPEMALVSPSQSGVVSASDGDKEKEKEKEKCTTTASPDAGIILRPRNTLSLEGVLHRDSRFIEDVS
jgi:hypothetical protein